MQTAQFQLHAQIEQRHWWFVARRRIVARLIEELLPPDPSTTIVDVGCGTGANLAALANRYRCVGIDTSPEAIGLASERFSQVKFLCGLAPEGLGEEMDRARLVLLMDVLEHVSDDFALFSNLVAAARPGTYFLVTVPADRRLWSQHDESFGHYRRYDRQRLEQVWNGLPVSTLLCSAYNSRLYRAVKAARTWSRWRGRAAGAAGTDFRLPAAPLNRLLEALLAGEARRLVAALGGRPQQGYRRGVSLIAVLRREA
jgi:SAM-dependent methyltransferase